MAIAFSGPLPATGAWQEGNHPGQRKFIDVGPIELELGGALPEVRVSYETYGKLNSNSSNAICTLCISFNSNLQFFIVDFNICNSCILNPLRQLIV